MQASTRPRLIAAAIVAAVHGEPPAHAGIWQPFDDPDHARRSPRSSTSGGDQPLVHDLELDLQARREPPGPSSSDRPGTELQRRSRSTRAARIGHRRRRRRASCTAINGARLGPAAGADDLQLPARTTARAPGGLHALGPGRAGPQARALGQRHHGRTSGSTAGGVLQRTVNGGQSLSEISRQSQRHLPRRRLGSEDVFVLPTQPEPHAVPDGYYSYVLPLHQRPHEPGRQARLGLRLLACTVDPSDPVARCAAGGVGCYRCSAISEDGGMTFNAPSMMNGSYAASYAFDAFGTTALGAGNAGYSVEQHRSDRDLPATRRRRDGHQRLARRRRRRAAEHRGRRRRSTAASS